jgi:hypothetical protein
MLITILILIAGFSMKKLDWRPLVVIGGLLLVMVPLKVSNEAASLARMGESVEGLWDWRNLSMMWGTSLLIQGVFLFIGFCAGQLYRRIKRKKE